MITPTITPGLRVGGLEAAPLRATLEVLGPGVEADSVIIVVAPSCTIVTVMDVGLATLLLSR
jgi:hypothetical protein